MDEDGKLATKIKRVIELYTIMDKRQPDEEEKVEYERLADDTAVRPSLETHIAQEERASMATNDRSMWGLAAVPHLERVTARDAAALQSTDGEESGESKETVLPEDGMLADCTDEVASLSPQWTLYKVKIDSDAEEIRFTPPIPAAGSSRGRPFRIRFGVIDGIDKSKTMWDKISGIMLTTIGVINIKWSPPGLAPLTFSIGPQDKEIGDIFFGRLLTLLPGKVHSGGGKKNKKSKKISKKRRNTKRKNYKKTAKKFKKRSPRTNTKRKGLQGSRKRKKNKRTPGKVKRSRR
jgi:hypothetical protein